MFKTKDTPAICMSTHRIALIIHGDSGSGTDEDKGLQQINMTLDISQAVKGSAFNLIKYINNYSNNHSFSFSDLFVH